MVGRFVLSEFLWQVIAIVLQIWDEMCCTILLYLRERLLAEVRLTFLKAQYKLHVASGLNLP